MGYERQEITFMLTPQLITQILYKASLVYNVDYFALFLHLDGDFKVIHSYPKEWVDFYLANRYQDYDSAHSSQFHPVLWDTASMSQGLGKEYELFERASDYNINAGYTMPLLFDNQLSYLTFSSGGNPLKQRESINQQRHMYHTLAHTLSLISCVGPKTISQPVDFLLGELTKQELELSERTHRLSIGRGALLSVAHACKSLPKELSKDIECLIETTFSVLK